MPWNPQQYLSYGNERLRPALDLMARIKLAAPQGIVDIGCGPGNVTAILRERWPDATITGIDNSPEMLNAARKIDGIDWQLADAATWQPEEHFDAVLLDAPCSSTGTIRRHPDIPYLKSPKDIGALAALQTRLLDNAASLLKPGGRLVYSTCSLEPEEGEAQVAALLVRNEALRLDAIAPDELYGQAEWIEPSGCLRTFPYELRLDGPDWSGMDGFFAARLVRAG